VYASLGNALDAVVGSVVGVFSPITAFRNFNGGYQADERYAFNYMNGSDAYRAGSDFGYTAAFIGLQVGLVAATKGLGELAPVAGGARWMEEADSLEMGGTMALRSGEEAGGEIGSAGSLRNTFTPEGQGEFGFVSELESTPGRSLRAPVGYQAEGGASQAGQLELTFGGGGSADVEWTAPAGWRLPANKGSWSGSPGNSSWKSELPEVNQMTGNRPVNFDHGYIELSPYKVTSYRFNNLTGLNTDFKIADAQLARDLQLNSPTAAKIWRSQNQLTWHHLEDGQTLQLVPTILNDIPHVGGASILRAQ
jgi:hypothetical protein